MSLEDFVAPQGVDPSLAGLAWLIGAWEGSGHVQSAEGGEPKPVEQRVEFRHNGGQYLFHVSQWFPTTLGGPTGMETGFWFPQPDASLDVVMANAEGRAEIWGGKIAPHRIDMVTDTVARTVTASVACTGGSRLFGLVEGDLMYAYDRALEGDSLKPHMWARLRRAETR